MGNLLIILIISMIPIGELRVSIPLGILHYHLNPWFVLIVGILGCFLPAVFFAYLLDPISQFLSNHSKFFRWFFNKLFSHTRSKHAKRFERLEEVALVLVSALPLPLFGSWSGALFAFVFGIEPKKSLPLIFLGVTIMGFSVLALTVGFSAII
jgi:uncharacterized membrane protein